MSTFTDYIRDTKGELKHVSWPTRKQAIVYTLLTVILSILLAVYLGLLILFSQSELKK